MKTLVVTVLDDAAEAKLRELVAQSTGLTLDDDIIDPEEEARWNELPEEVKESILRGLEQAKRGEGRDWNEVYPELLAMVKNK